MQRVSLILAAFASAVLAFQASVASPSHAAGTTWDLQLMGIQENPPVLDDAAAGTVHLTFEDATRSLSYSINVWGVAGELVTAGHIHAGPAPVGVNTAPKYPLLDKGQTQASGTITIDAADVPNLLAGDMYINVHTVAHPGGAARAQIEPTIKTIYRMEINARNKFDVDTLVSLFADNGQQIGGGSLCTANPCITKDQLRRNFTPIPGENVQFKTVDVRVNGNTLVAREEVRQSVFTLRGIEREVQIATETYQGQQILVRRVVVDTTDSQTAQYENFVRVNTPAALLFRAIEQGNISTGLGLFSDDAVFEGFGLCAPVACTGKAAIQKEVEREAADKIAFSGVNITAFNVSGDTLTSQQEIRSDSIRASGVERILAQRTSELREGKVVLLRLIPAVTDPQTARFLSQGPSIRAPSTGDGGLLPH